jgi:hypothetical protein
VLTSETSERGEHASSICLEVEDAASLHFAAGGGEEAGKTSGGMEREGAKEASLCAASRLFRDISPGGIFLRAGAGISGKL